MNANPPQHRPLGPLLLLSDCQEVRRLASASLRVNRWQVHEFDSVQALTDQIDSYTELVIADGNGDWKQLIEYVDQMPAPARVPVLLLRLEGHRQERLVSRLHGSLDSATLPFNPTTIHQQVLSAVWQHRLQTRQLA